MGRMTKAMLAYLKQVEAGRVYRIKGYTTRRGGYERFVGGEARTARAVALGLVTRPATPVIGRPAKATLTDAGRRALAEKGE